MKKLIFVLCALVYLNGCAEPHSEESRLKAKPKEPECTSTETIDGCDYSKPITTGRSCCQIKCDCQNVACGIWDPKCMVAEHTCYYNCGISVPKPNT